DWLAVAGAPDPDRVSRGTARSEHAAVRRESEHGDGVFRPVPVAQDLAVGGIPDPNAIARGASDAPAVRTVGHGMNRAGGLQREPLLAARGVPDPHRGPAARRHEPAAVAAERQRRLRARTWTGADLRLSGLRVPEVNHPVAVARQTLAIGTERQCHDL